MVVSLAASGAGARIYTVNGGGAQSKSASAWLEAKLGNTRKRRGGGQGGKGGEGEIRLIQDFDFPEASNKIKSTRDGQYVLATGTYKPRMKVFDLEELSLKTERVTDSENVDFCILSSDWTKTLHLQADRSLELHTQSSAHYRVRMPRHGRALAYHFPSCDALVGGQGNEVWRMNLEAGRFMKPYALEGAAEADGGEGGVGFGGGDDVVTGVNAIDINPAHQLLSFGTETEMGRGTVEMWDPRSRSRAALLRLPYAKLLAASGSSASLLGQNLPGIDDIAVGKRGVSVTALASKFDGLNLAVGTSTGHVLLYDLRANRAYTTKDQGYGLPIKKVEWIDSGVASGGDAEAEGGWLASADEKVVKIWGKETGTNLVSINPPMPINDMHIYPGTGLVFLANETSPMSGYYVPQLGPAPKWCRFLDNMTEEMEDGQEELMYDDYKFVDRQELDSLNLTHLIGTDSLKPYMHGYFLDLRLYTKARAIANPFAYAEHRERLIREKLDKEQESRIRGAKQAIGGVKLPEGVKVNRSLAKKAREAEERTQKRSADTVEGEEGGEEEGEQRKRKRKSGVETPSLLKDSRFGQLFTNPDYQIDEDSREFALLNPSTKPQRQEELDEHDSADEDGSDNSDEDDSDSSDDGDLGFDNRKAKREPAPRRPKDVQSSAPTPIARPKPSLIVAEDSDDDSNTTSIPRTRTSYEQRASQTFGQRAREAASSTSSKKRSTEAEGDPFEVVRGAPGGGMEMSFIPAGKSEDEKAADGSREKAKAKAREDKAQFGAGLENRSNAKDEEVLDGEDGSGRQKMRKGVRSASRTVVRQLK
ncbi:hypothetical protein RQP46_002836 [Phenoliferia psychrophenolica]